MMMMSDFSSCYTHVWHNTHDKDKLWQIVPTYFAIVLSCLRLHFCQKKVVMVFLADDCYGSVCQYFVTCCCGGLSICLAGPVHHGLLLSNLMKETCQWLIAWVQTMHCYYSHDCLYANPPSMVCIEDYIIACEAAQFMYTYMYVYMNLMASRKFFR